MRAGERDPPQRDGRDNKGREGGKGGRARGRGGVREGGAKKKSTRHLDAAKG